SAGNPRCLSSLPVSSDSREPEPFDSTAHVAEEQRISGLVHSSTPRRGRGGGCSEAQGLGGPAGNCPAAQRWGTNQDLTQRRVSTLREEVPAGPNCRMAQECFPACRVPQPNRE